MTLASAAPISVPATPKNEATTAEDTAASALAATCAALSDVFFGCSDEGRTAVSVRGEDMGSGGRADGNGGRYRQRAGADLASQATETSWGPPVPAHARHPADQQKGGGVIPATSRRRGGQLPLGGQRGGLVRRE